MPQKLPQLIGQLKKEILNLNFSVSVSGYIRE
jgi:hypothetical protein